MDKIILKESVITSVTKNTFREIVIKLKISPDEYTPDLEEQLYTLRQNNESVVVLIQPSGYTPPPEQTESRLGHLHKCMLRYSDMSGTDIAVLVKDMYTRYGVSTRKDLTPEQVETEIAWFISQ